MKTEMDFIEITQKYLSTSCSSSIKPTNINPLSFPISESACGKAIVVGEHAVVYGAKAIALPLRDLRLELSIKEDIPALTNSRPLSLKQKKLRSLMDQSCQNLGLPPIPYEIEAHSNILMGAGLGSSAALCVALIKLAFKTYAKKINPSLLATVAKKLERNFHGTPSGLDTTVVSYEKPILFQKHKKTQLIHISQPCIQGKFHKWPFVLIDSGLRAPTSLMVERAKPFFMSKNQKKIIKSFDDIALNTLEALQDGDIQKLAHNMNLAESYLENADVLPQIMQKQKEQILNCDVLSVKITGAGGGGCFLSLLDPSNFKAQFEKLSKLFGAHNLYSIFI